MVDGQEWHVLHRPAAGVASLTVLAVHGNPTWAYLWRELLAHAPADWRVIAVDQLGMGYSQRTTPRRLADRVTDLGRLTEVMGVSGPVMTVAHDWGGPVSLGWLLAHKEQVSAAVLFNTAVHQPAQAAAPRLIKAARWRPIHDLVTRKTPTFVNGTTTLSRLAADPLADDVRDAYRAPYLSADRRGAVADFVADIPLNPDHPSAATLDQIAADICDLDIPVFLSWGVGDPVFSDVYLRDLLQRLPRADVHRYEKAGHLVTEDAPTAISDAIAWMQLQGLPGADQAQLRTDPVATGQYMSVNPGRSDDVALADMGSGRQATWGQLTERVEVLAAGLVARGVRPGERVAMLITPGPDLVAAVYACWRLGAVVVVADSGLGISGMRRALRGSHVRHVIGIAAGIGLARTLSVPGLRILAGEMTTELRRGLRVDATLAEVADAGRAVISAGVDTPTPVSTDAALIAFTSGSTGPAKGVLYSHHRLRELCSVLTRTYDLQPGRDALVAAFAPWAVLGPALGAASAIPAMDITDPSTLTMEAFSAAAEQVQGTIAWTSPTGLRAIIDTAAHTSARPRHLRQLLVAGAPVPVATLEQAAQALPNTAIATPYGMTEALPLTHVDLDQLRNAPAESGVLVGRPLDGVTIGIAPFTSAGDTSDPVSTPGVSGEVIVKANWVMSGYDRRWAQQWRSRTADDSHRTGDVGHLDADGRLWIEGRLAHVITTAQGPVTPVAIEHVAAEVAGTALAGCVGVGPRGGQVIVIALPGSPRGMRVADVDLTMKIRQAVYDTTGHDVAAVIQIPELPVDVRHRSKINRGRIAAEAAVFLAGSANGGRSS